jgi:hypothetical protein
MLEMFELAQTEKDRHLRKYGRQLPRAEMLAGRLAQRSMSSPAHRSSRLEHIAAQSGK